MIIPAAVLIPRDSQIRDAYNRLLTDWGVHELPIVCPKCGQWPCVCTGDGPGGPRTPRDVLVTVLESAELAGLSHDGDEIDMGMFDPFSELLAAPRRAAHLPPCVRGRPCRGEHTNRGSAQLGCVDARVDLREQMYSQLELIDRCAAWWVHNGDTDVTEFQVQVNREMGDRHR